MPDHPPPSVREDRVASRGLLLRRSLLALSGVVFLVAVLFMVWSVKYQSREAGPSVTLSHVHGIAVNPADGMLYVATHEGLFVLDENGSAELVGESRQDIMGFTVIGPDHFLASGHPAPGQDAPASLGLIESTDGGLTWDSVLLNGEADFHALRYAHDTVYGFDSVTGQLLARTGSGEWETRSAEPLTDFVVNPVDPDSIVAVGVDGPLRSVDGGRTWMPLEIGSIAFLHWTNSGLLWGIGPSGEIYDNYDQGATWRPTVGSAEVEPVAFTAVGDSLYVAASDGRIISSDDFGRSWRELYRSPA
jgi:photosystem II stability/assembly factor-like uncharacterized protein